LRESLARAEAGLRERQEDLARLTIVAPRDGMVIPPSRVPKRPGADESQLSGWTGTPLDEKNLGATLTPEGPESLLCQIGDPQEWDAVMVIDQYDARELAKGQEVRLMFEESAYHVFVTGLDTLAADEMATAPARLASTNGGPLAVQPEQDGTLTPLNTSYRATARVNDPYGMLRNGLIGQARIETRPRTLAWRIMRYLGRTFNFDI
jgi:putative peptide zinc metalloprotease protein